MKFSNASRIFVSTAGAGIIAGILSATVPPSEQAAQRVDDQSATKTSVESKQKPKPLNMTNSRRLSRVEESGLSRGLA